MSYRHIRGHSLQIQQSTWSTESNKQLHHTTRPRRYWRWCQEVEWGMRPKERTWRPSDRRARRWRHVWISTVELDDLELTRQLWPEEFQPVTPWQGIMGCRRMQISRRTPYRQLTLELSADNLQYKKMFWGALNKSMKSAGDYIPFDGNTKILTTLGWVDHDGSTETHSIFVWMCENYLFKIWCWILVKSEMPTLYCKCLNRDSTTRGLDSTVLDLQRNSTIKKCLTIWF